MPFAVAIASMLQSCIFLAVQSQSLNTMWSSGCTLTAQLVWPSKLNSIERRAQLLTP